MTRDTIRRLVAWSKAHPVLSTLLLAASLVGVLALASSWKKGRLLLRAASRKTSPLVHAEGSSAARRRGSGRRSRTAPQVIEHRLGLRAFSRQVRSTFEAPLWKTWLDRGPFRAFTSTPSQGPAHVYCWDAVTTQKLRAHEYGHTPAGGRHEHEPWDELDIMSRYPPRIHDQHGLQEAYDEARREGMLVVRRE